LTAEGKRIPGIGDMAGLTRTLIQGHIPFGWISDTNLKNLSRHRMVLVPDFVDLSEGEQSPGGVCERGRKHDCLSRKAPSRAEWRFQRP